MVGSPSGRLGVITGMVWLCMTAFASADVFVAYWDLNGSLNRSDGTSGTLTTYVDGSLISFQDYGIGTTVNLRSGFVAGDSRLFFNLASIGELGAVEITGLNLTGLQDPVLSFAVRKDSLLEPLDFWEAEYNDGSGWQTAGIMTEPDTEYSLRFFDFSGISSLTNNSNVGLRISWFEPVSLLDVLEFDNVLVNATAVPEPGSVLLLGLGAAFLWRRKRKP